MLCKFYGRVVDQSGTRLIPTINSECALLSDPDRRCIMQAIGQPIELELCEMNGSAEAHRVEGLRQPRPISPEGFTSPAPFHQAPRTSQPQEATAELDEKLVELLRVSVKEGDPEDGFTPVMKHHQLPGAGIRFDRSPGAGVREGRYEVERLLIYAWGPSADRLAKTLGIAPGDLNHTIEAPELLPSASARDQVIEAGGERK